MYNNILEKVGKVVSYAAKKTPHEVELHNCIVEELSRDKISDLDSLYYRDGKPTTLIFDDDEIALETVCIQAQAALTELKAKPKTKTVDPDNDICVNFVHTTDFPSSTKPRKKKKPQITEEEKRRNFEKYWVRPLQELLIEE